jgi:hypothetical protein
MARAPRKPKPEEMPPPPATAVLPMQLRVGDRFTDERGEWEVVGRPTGFAGGKTVRALVRRAGEAGGSEERLWDAHERVAVRRA